MGKTHPHAEEEERETDESMNVATMIKVHFDINYEDTFLITKSLFLA